MSSGSSLAFYLAFLTSLRILQPTNLVWNLLHGFLHLFAQKQNQRWGFLPEIYWGSALKSEGNRMGQGKSWVRMWSQEKSSLSWSQKGALDDDSHHRACRPRVQWDGLLYTIAPASQGSGTCTSFLCHFKICKFSSLTRIYHLTVSVTQESGHSLVGSPARSLKAVIQVSAGSHLRLRVVFKAHVVGGRIHVLGAEEPVVAYFFKVGRRMSPLHRVA